MYDPHHPLRSKLPLLRRALLAALFFVMLGVSVFQAILFHQTGNALCWHLDSSPCIVLGEPNGSAVHGALLVVLGPLSLAWLIETPFAD
jgi:hypothetical protein